LPQPQGGDQGLEVGDLQVGFGLRRRGRAEAPLGRPPVDPGGVGAHLLGRHVVVEEAFGPA
jgi:hypothetical protein